jgi:hypothetical protein
VSDHDRDCCSFSHNRDQQHREQCKPKFVCGIRGM